MGLPLACNGSGSPVTPKGSLVDQDPTFVTEFVSLEPLLMHSNIVSNPLLVYGNLEAATRAMDIECHKL